MYVLWYSKNLFIYSNNIIDAESEEKSVERLPLLIVDLNNERVLKVKHQKPLEENT